MNSTRYGLLSYGSYIPSIRLSRKAIAEAVSWAVPGVRGLAAGERTVANWDEDTITMAVEAGRDCLQGVDIEVDQISLASTTLPFADRSNCGLVADALQLGPQISTADMGGSRRAATSALARMATSSSTQTTLLLASDCRETKPGSTQEMLYGHGAAALLVGPGEPIAEFLGATSMHDDLVDQYRAAGAAYDYALEERWVREVGYLKIVPEVVGRLLDQTGTDLQSIQHIVLQAPSGAARALAKALGIDAKNYTDNLAATVGDCGVANPLLTLSVALSNAGAGEKILVIGFGQGADAILLETTTKLSAIRDGRGPARYLARQRKTDNYTFFLSLRNRISLDFGLRAERDNRTALSTFYRKRLDITAMLGGRCSACDTLQFPSSVMCVKCGESNTQKPESLSGQIGRVKSFTEDWLAYTPSPPYIYGNVEFSDGANVMLEFTDFEPGQMSVGNKVRMVFRIKDIDHKRNFHRYFWKPAPLLDAE